MFSRTVLVLILVTSWATFGNLSLTLLAEETAQQVWDENFGKPGADGAINQLAVISSGPEQGVYFGGEFRHIAGKYIPALARFDGAKWHQVGDGCPCAVDTLLVDAGIEQPVIYVAGKAHLGGATIVAEYRSGQWRTLADAVVGLNQRVHAMAIHALKANRFLLIGGSFTEVRAKAAAEKLPPPKGMNVAAWDGKSWSGIAQGLQGQVSVNGFGGFGGTTSTGPHAVRGLVSTVESGRAIIYAGGDFTESGKTPLPGLARYERPEWRAEEGIAGSVHCLCMYDDGTGNALYAGGALHLPKDYGNVSGVWRRIDGKWQPVGDGIQYGSSKPTILTLAPFSYGGTTRLLACGWFSSSGSTSLPKVALWDGKRWSAPDWLPTNTGNQSESSVADPSEYGLRSIVAYQDALYFGGSFRHIANRPAEKIARIGNGTSRQVTEATPTPTASPALPASVNLTNTNYRLTKVIPAARWDSGDLRFTALSNTGRVAVANPTKIPVPVEVAAPLFEDNPFTPPKRGIPSDPHLIRDRILLWDSNNQNQLTLPGDEPKYAWKSVCVSPDGKQLVATETRTLGSRSSYRWDGKKWLPIPRPQNHEVVIHGVNDSGVMVGTSDVGDPRNGREAVVIRNGRTQVLPSPAHKAIAVAVSNSGLIAGQALDKFGLAQACLWKDEQPALLGTMGGKSSIAHAVNDSGMVVGLLRKGRDQETAFVWQNGQMRVLMEPSSTSSIAYDINNSGVIVGLAYGPKTYGFIASGEQVLNLNDLLLESPGWTVTKAVAVNDENCVLAIAEHESQEHLVLLSPST